MEDVVGWIKGIVKERTVIEQDEKKSKLNELRNEKIEDPAVKRNIPISSEEKDIEINICKGINSRGKPCKLKPKQGEVYCHYHLPQ